MGNTEYAYVLQLKRPPSIKQGLGIAAHEAVGFNMAQKTLTYRDLPKEEVVQKFVDEWDILSVEIEDVPVEKTRKENKAQAKDSGIKAVLKHTEKVASRIQPVWVEEQIQFKLNDEIDWTGIFDLADDKGRVRDHKFVGRKPDDGGEYILPMVGYALGYRQLTNDIETEIVLDYIVRTKEPYYLPLASGGPISDAAISEFAKIVTQVKRSIDAGIFMPTGLESRACGWCGYNDICPAYRATHAGHNE